MTGRKITYSQGQTLVEVALVLALVAIVAIVAMSALGANTKNLLCVANNTLSAIIGANPKMGGDPVCGDPTCLPVTLLGDGGTRYCDCLDGPFGLPTNCVVAY